MGAVGRPPKPTALKVLEGNPGKRPLNKREPRPTAGAPTRPEWLLPEAKREWNRLVPELTRLGLLATVDRASLSAYCQCWAMYVDAVKDIKENGTTFVTDKGYEGPRPSVAIMNQMLQRMGSLSAKFGFTPSDRARIAVPPQEGADEFSQFLAQMRAVNE